MDDVRTWRVPGRVNLIGEHLDYNGGPSLPFAIDRHVTLKARRRDDATINAWTTLPDGRRDKATWSSRDDDPRSGWVSYVAGTARAVREATGAAVGADLVVESDVPLGAGLSSSAALTVAVAAAMSDLSGADLTPLQLARLSQHAENTATGAPTGLMDQLAVTFGRAGHAVLVRPLREEPVERLVPWDPSAAGLALLVIDTRVSHQLSDGGYGERREECERAAAELGVEHLADAGLQALVGLQDPVLAARTRHVFTETARVTAALRSLGEGDWPQLGTVLTASHTSLRDDFAVSCAELDVAVEAATEAGALGARMTGGGFGGSAIALVPQDKARAVRELVEQRFDALGWAAPAVFAVRPGDGAHRAE